jgi:hypothetical protein
MHHSASRYGASGTPRPIADGYDVSEPAMSLQKDLLQTIAIATIAVVAFAAAALVAFGPTTLIH